jgi:hypothetical protein
MLARVTHWLARGAQSDDPSGLLSWLRSVVQGYFNYYAVPGNLDSMGLFRERVLRYWGQALKRRSQRHRYAWVRRLKLAAQWLPTPARAPSLAP